MKKLLFTFSLLTLLVTSNLYAAGLGVYTSGSAGSLIHKHDGKTFDIVDDPEYYANLAVGGGLILDSNISQKYLSYRYNFGVEKLYEVQYGRYRNDYTRLIRINFLNTIAIPLIVNDAFKLWIGPQFNLQFTGGYYISDTSRVCMEASLFMGSVPPFVKKMFFVDVLYSFGVSLGINMKLSGNFYFTGEACFRGGVISQLKNEINYIHKYEYEFALLAGILYKIGD